jgi:hypothetical protein
LAKAQAELKEEQKRADGQALLDSRKLCRQTRDEYQRLEQAFREAEAHAQLCQLAYRKTFDELQQLRREFTAEEFPTDEETAEYERRKLRLEKVLADALYTRDIARSKCAPLQLAALRAAKEYEQLQFRHRNLKARVNGDPLTGPLGGVASIG